MPPHTKQQDEGEEVDLELPASSKAAVFIAPPPLKSTLLDVTLPLSLAAVWLALFGGSSSLLADFHQQLGDLVVTISAWRRQKGELPTNVGLARRITVDAGQADRLPASIVPVRAALRTAPSTCPPLRCSAADGSPPRRLLKYTTPLSNRLGPRQAFNTGACGGPSSAC